MADWPTSSIIIEKTSYAFFLNYLSRFSLSFKLFLFLIVTTYGYYQMTLYFRTSEITFKWKCFEASTSNLKKNTISKWIGSLFFSILIIMIIIITCTSVPDQPGPPQTKTKRTKDQKRKQKSPKRRWRQRKRRPTRRQKKLPNRPTKKTNLNSLSHYSSRYPSERESSDQKSKKSKKSKANENANKSSFPLSLSLP